MSGARHRLLHTRGAWLLAAALAVVCLAGRAEADARQYTLDNDPLRLGNRALADGRLAEARARYEESVANDHQLPEAFFGLARVAEREARYADAETHCRQALAAAGGTHPRARATLGLLLLRSGRNDEARAALDRALQEDSGLWETHYGLARLLLADGDTAGAERSALLAATLNPADPEYGELVARLYAARGYDTLAISAYEQLLAKPGVAAPAPLLHALGRLYAGQHRYNDASSRYLQAVAADSTYAPAVLDLAELFRLAKRWDKAAGTYLRYVDLAPDDAAARLGLAEALFELGRYDEAAAAARAAGELAPGDTAAALLFVRAGLRARDPAVAAEAMTRQAGLPADTPWQAADLLELAARQEAAGDPAAAMASLARAAELDPERPQIPYRQGMIALRAGRPADAVEPFARAAALAPDSPVYVLNLGIARYQAGDPAAAVPAFRQAVAVDDSLVAARLLLAQALAATGELADAEAEYDRVHRQEPGNAKALRGIGFCRLRRADYAGAAEVYAAATAAEPDNADGWAGLGSARLGLADLEAAARAFDRARALDADNPMLKAGSELLNKARNAGKDDQPK